MAPVPLVYKAFFLWIEPFFTLLGAFYAFFLPQTYLDMTRVTQFADTIGSSVAALVALRQLGNLYLAFAINEAVVLRATSDRRVWQALLLGLLIADFGHLYSLYPLGLDIYYGVMKWGPMDWGNIAFVYCGATARICFLTGVGLGTEKKLKTRVSRRSIKPLADNTITLQAQETQVKTPKSTRGKRSKAG
jgi:hypothetical protein